MDALLAARYNMGFNPAGLNPANAGVNCDTGIAMVDALLIPRYDED
jgi:hypothetical protein